MEYDEVYIVINEGELVYASTDKDSADAYAESKGYEARTQALDDMGIDDPTEKDIADADQLAGYGGYYDVQVISLYGKEDDDCISLEDGTELCVWEIKEKLEENQGDEYDFF